MKTDNVPMTNTDERKESFPTGKEEIAGERKEASTIDPKQLKPDDNGAASEIRDSELEKLEIEIKDLFSSLPDEDDSVHSMIRRSLLKDFEDNAYVVKHGQAIKSVKPLLGATVFTVEEGAYISEIHINSETTLQIPSCNKGDEVYAIGHPVRGQFVAMIVSSESFFKMFDLVTNIPDKFKMMKKFLQLSAGQQNNIQQQLSGKKYGLASSETAVRFKELDELKLKFEICRETYSHQQQRDIENLFDECRGIGKHGKTLLKLKYILNITPTTSVGHIPDRETLFKTLNKRLYKLDKVKTEIVEAIIASKFSRDHSLRLLLVGNPGTGKTTIIQSIAEAYSLPYDIIHLNGVCSALEIKGTDSSYDGSDAGKLVKSFYQLGTTEAVIGLDEIDKMASGGKDGNPADALLDTLSDEHVCYDAFLETSIDTHNTIYIATANSTRNIPEFLINRFKVIAVDDYEDEEKVVIAKEYVIPQLLEDYSLSSNDIEFPDAVILYMVKQFCSDSGVRILKESIHSIIRRIVNQWEVTGYRSKAVVDASLVNERLEPSADANNAQLRYHRNKTLFGERVRVEIKKSFALLQDFNMDPHKKESTSRKIEYLTSIIPEVGGFESFDKQAFFDCISNTHFGLLSVKDRIAKSFYAKALKKRSFSSERILLAGGPGIGKSSICKSIAKGLDIPYIKISLNGVSDTHALKGFESTYVGSDAGIIVRELAKAGTTRVLIQLDALIDLLDNSSEFTDVFLGVPLDLSNVLFIATANDISHMEPWLLDRFSVIRLDGYTYADKEQILDKYLLPKLELEYAEAGIAITVSDEAKRSLLIDYCPSFGVRDIEKAVEQIVNDLLYKGEAEKSICIEVDDVTGSLGPKPIPRGNLLKKNVPGFAKALAVSGNNSGMSFSIESVIIPSDNTTCITGLPKESAVDSVKLAKTFIRTHYLENNEDFGVHLHFGEGAVVKDGPSAGVAIMISMLSAVFKMPVEGNVAYTGEIDLFGNVFAIGGTLAKVQAAEQSGCSKVFIPRSNYEQLRDSDIEQFSVEVVPVDHVNEVIDVVLPNIHFRSRNLSH